MNIIRNVQRKVMKITVMSVKVQSTPMFQVLQKRNQMKMVLMETAQLMMPKMALLQKTLDIMYIINFVKNTQIWSAQG